MVLVIVFFFQAEDGIRDLVRSRGLGDVYKRQVVLQLIKEINPLAIIIVVSAQDDLEKALETIRQGATDYFLKTNKTVFANIVSSLLKLKELEKNKLN